LRFRRSAGRCAALAAPGARSDTGHRLRFKMARILSDAAARFPIDAAQSSRGRNQPVPQAARGQSRRLVSVGRGGDRAGAAGEQAHSVVGRIFRLPLVPRHGARVVRGPRDGSIDEQRVREHQGRPRGAAGSRQDLSSGATAHHRPVRRMAVDHVLESRGSAAVLRRDVFSARAALRHARVQGAAAESRGVLPRSCRGDSTAGRKARRNLQGDAARQGGPQRRAR
jgi:hypothetical protein